MPNVDDALNVVSESRMKYGHAIVMLIYGMTALLLIGPFAALIVVPPNGAVPLETVGPYYWSRMIDSDLAGILLYFSVAFNAGMILSSLIYLPPMAVKPRETLRRFREAMRIVISSDTFDKAGQYARFVFWIEEKPARQRVRSWDWFASNAYATFLCLMSIYFVLNLLALFVLAAFPWTSEFLHLTFTFRSLIYTLVLMLGALALVPGVVKHYIARGEADEILLNEFYAEEAASDATKRSDSQP